jgi:hypothetical protein
MSQILTLHRRRRHHFLSHLRHCEHVSCLRVRMTLRWLPTTHTLTAGSPKYNGTPHTGGPSLHLSQNPMWFLSFQTSLCFCRVGAGGGGIWCSGVYFTPPGSLFSFFFYGRCIHNHKVCSERVLGNTKKHLLENVFLRHCNKWSVGWQIY